MERPDIVQFVTDPNLLGLSVSPAQETLLRTAYGLPLTDEQFALYRDCTGRMERPRGPFGEVTVIAGARSGKDSRVAAPIVLFEALFGGHERHLAKGERGINVLVAQDFRATRVAYGYIRDYLTRSPLLASMVAEIFTSEIVLTSGLVVAAFPCTLRSLRAWSIPVGVLDEMGFYRLEGAADSDAEIQASVRRGMIGFPSPRLVKISTPYMKSGVLWSDFRQAWGQENLDLLCWRAPTALMNPTITPERLAREQRLDPARFEREFMATFAEDLEAFLPSAWVDDAVVAGRHELPPREDVGYVAAVDPSGGGADAFTLSIVHAEGAGSEARIVQDVVKGWSRAGSHLAGVVGEIARILKAYGLSEVVGDRYAAGWVRGAFQEQGVDYRDAPKTKGEVYLEIEPWFAQARVELLDHPQLIRELKILERRPRAGGKTQVDHPHGAHDDHANALCLAAFAAMPSPEPSLGEVHVTVLGWDYDPRAKIRGRPKVYPAEVVR